jgi:hypothetical protein
MRNECLHCDRKFDCVTEGTRVCARPECQRAERITANIRAMGSDAVNVRDAVHEACHAMMWGLQRKWTRDNITKKNPYRRRPALGVRDEITARAVEALVVRSLGLEYDQDKWLLMMVMETLKFDRIALPSHEWVKEAVTARMGTREADVLATNLIDRFDVPVKAKRKRTVTPA